MTEERPKGHWLDGNRRERGHRGSFERGLGPGPVECGPC